MTAPLQYGTPPAGDPTAVMGRRSLAWIADLLIYVAIVAAGFASMAEYTEIPPGVLEEEACDLFEEQNPGAADACIAADGSIYLLDTGEAGVQTVLSLGWLAFFIVLQGLTGGSPGKLLFGLRVVDQYGAKCGLGKSLARTLLWVVDAAPWIIPLVGPIAAFTSSGHRRVGDLAAGTYVVASSSVGQPILTSNAPIPAGQQAWGAAPPTAPPTAPPAADQGWQTAPPRDGRWESPAADAQPDLDFRTLDVPESGERVDEQAPTVHADPDWSHAPDLDVTPPPAVQELDERADADAAAAGQAPPGAPEWEPPTSPGSGDPEAWEPPTSPSADWSSSAPHDPAPATEPPPFAAPGADGPPTAPPQSEAPEPPAAAPRYELPPPQWDQARGTYIQWEPNRQAWLQWDDGNQRWKPIDS
ncbi:MAG TPA: RDD family protein [Acidimicrobiales bacterium]|nr:RDD family protein [Acidimicrobiales bacterium]